MKSYKVLTKDPCTQEEKCYLVKADSFCCRNDGCIQFDYDNSDGDNVDVFAHKHWYLVSILDDQAIQHVMEVT